MAREKQKQSEKTAKNEMFPPNFFAEFFREFSVCVFPQWEQQTPRKNGLPKFQHKNSARHDDSIKNADQVVLQT